VDLLLPLGFAGAVLVIAALAAGFVDRAPLSFPALFLALGLVLGDGATGVLTLELDDPLLTVLAVTLLSLVLFLDAAQLDVRSLVRDWHVPALTLGPGTLLTIAGTALATSWLFDTPWAVAAVVGACLASTDAVTLRDVLRDERIAPSVRRALGVEAGVNDLLVLPLLLVAAAVASNEATSAGDWTSFLLRLLVLGPLLGAVIGGGGASVMGRTSARRPVREEYQSLYGIGLVLLAFVAGEVVGGSGFLAAVAAGFAVNTVNHDLCDCFLSFGQNLAEVLLLVAFVLFGAMLSGTLTVASAPAGLALAALVLFIVRPVAVTASLATHRSVLSWEGRAVIAWFGPRGLASLLLALLVLQRGVPGTEQVVAAVGWTVIASVVLHGVSATPVAAWYGRRAAARTLPESREGEALDVLVDRGTQSPRLSVAELARDQAGGSPWTVVDVRTPGARAAEPEVIPGSLAVSPADLRDLLDGLPAGSRLAFWCTCQQEATAARAARRAEAAGFEAVAILGGLHAWRDAGHPVLPLEVTGVA
jgi:sodium/hydrogen antiporter